jgi:hypothetical protein
MIFSGEGKVRTPIKMRGRVEAVMDQELRCGPRGNGGVFEVEDVSQVNRRWMVLLMVDGDVRELRLFAHHERHSRDRQSRRVDVESGPHAC